VSAPNGKAASSPTSATRKEDTAAKPLVFLVPRPKVAASLAKP